MTSQRRAHTAALGVAPHSGWAAVIALGGPFGEPRLLARSRIEMFDPADPEAKQPYHTVEPLPVAEAARRLQGYRKEAESMARTAIRRLVHELDRSGHSVVSLGILDSSGRKGGSLADILASHALIHTADGEHYRDALAAAADANQLDVSRVRARDLEGQAAKRLGRPAGRLRDAVLRMGREAGPPWGADQKAAALLAWLLLAPRSGH